MSDTHTSEQQMPMDFRWLSANRLYSFYPWYILREKAEIAAIRSIWSGDQQTALFRPFARRDDNAEIAVFVEDPTTGDIGERVLIVEAHWNRSDAESTSGPREFADLWTWLREAVIPEMSAWAHEEQLEIFGREK